MAQMLDSLVAWLQAWFGEHIEWKQVFLVACTPFFLLGFALEWWVMRRRKALGQFDGKDIMANLNLGGSYQVFDFLAYFFLLGGVILWIWEHRIATIPLTAWTIPVIFIGVEFCYYWFHRLSHRVRWFWSAHVVHHSGEHMNLTTAMRQSMLYPITGWWLFFAPLVWLGVHPAAVFVLYAIDLAYQYFVHTEAVDKLPRWAEYWLNTPSNHRVHHGRNPQYIDKNYGGVLICFDRWFGTYEPEVEKVDYGIVRQVHSHNILVLNFHEFLDMWRDVLRPGPLWQRLKHLWKPPEWVRGQP